MVTGGGRGIGRGITERFLAAGAEVAVFQRSELSPELAEHPRVLHVSLDMSQVTDFEPAISRVVETFGGVDILVNNAGMMQENRLEDLDSNSWSQMMSVNVAAPVFLTQAVLPVLRQRDGGSVITIGSVEGFAVNPEHIGYAASKAAVHGMTRAMAVDLGEYGIRCNSIAPGWITSELSETYLESSPDPDTARQPLLGMHPVGRLGVPEDIGETAVFLASDSSQFLTGQVIVVDGGRTVKLPTPKL